MLIKPSGKDIKAARNYLDWPQKDLAEKCRVSIQSINLIEKNKQTPSEDLANRITEIFYHENILFHKKGGFQIDDDIIKIFSGDTAYFDLQKDIVQTMTFRGKEEILYLGADDKKSSSEVIENEIKLFQLRIHSKTIIAKGNTFIFGELENYRWVDPKYFASDVTVIYADKVAFTTTTNNKISKIVLIKDKDLNRTQKEYFQKLWKEGKKPSKTTAPFSYKSLSAKKQDV